RPLRHGPGFQYAIDTEPKIVVQACGVVALHTEVVGTALARLFGWRRFRRVLEAAFFGVFIESHKCLSNLPFTSYSTFSDSWKHKAPEATTMAASVWKGHLTFGLVTIPVRLFSAARSETISFNLLHKDDHSRIRQVTYCQLEDKPISRAETVKGYEYEK